MSTRFAIALLACGCTHLPLKLTVTTGHSRATWQFESSVPSFIGHLRNRSGATLQVASVDVQVDSLVCDGRPISPSQCADVLYGVRAEIRELPPGKAISFPIDIGSASVSGYSSCFVIMPTFSRCEATFVYQSRGGLVDRAQKPRSPPSNRVRFQIRAIVRPQSPRVEPRPPDYPGEPVAP